VGNPEGFKSVASILQSNYSSPEPISEEELEVVQSYLGDFAREFNDRAPLKSSVTRTVKLYERSGLSMKAFIEKMYEARSITKDKTASIRS